MRTCLTRNPEKENESLVARNVNWSVSPRSDNKFVIKKYW